MEDKIIIKGAKEHNLKDVNLELPRNKFIVFMINLVYKMVYPIFIK